jgi:hypothetical protein
MALVKIEGTIDRTLGENGIVGFWVKETVSNITTGQSWDVSWTVWSKTFTAKIGDMVEVKGELSVQTREYTDRNGQKATTIDRNINTPEIKILRAALPPVPDASWASSIPDVEPF